MEEAGLSPEEVLAVGDRLDTDIESGRRAGCDTFLVLTGVEQVAPEGQQHGATLRSLL
jgi:4-nitrophenyl phosphatase